MDKKTKFILAVGLQLAVVIIIVIFKMAQVSSGTEVVLKIEPYDPRDILRGDYVTFRYSNLSTIGTYSYTSSGDIYNGDTVYVGLIQSGPYWTYDNGGLHKEKPDNVDVIYLKGKVTSGGADRYDSVPKKTGYYSSSYNITYGLEQYYIPEGKGQGVSFWNHELYAKVSVTASGDGVLKQIYMDGKKWP